MTLRACEPGDLGAILEIINDGASAYRGVIPEDCWHEPYMAQPALEAEIADGVRFWGIEVGGALAAVMGMQDRGEVVLIRHAYVRTRHRRVGLGGKLLAHLEAQVAPGIPVLVGTWRAAHWAVAFYLKHGYRLLGEEEVRAVLPRYWRIPERQIETSVVLARTQ